MPEDPPTALTNYFDRDNLFLEHLHRGFAYLRAGSIAGFDETVVYENGLPKVLSKVMVHFMDPTSAASGRIKSPKAGDSNSGADLELYQRISTILERDYQNTLTEIPYKHYRTGKPATIPKLHLQPAVSHGGILMVEREEEPTEWHMNPLCHVYLAACHSVEHYRTQVKPSIQIFVSQLQAATESKSSNDPPHYLIVLVPMAGTASGRPGLNSTTSGDLSGMETSSTISSASGVSTEPTTSAPKSRVASFASRMAAARQRISAATTTASSTVASGANDELSGVSDDEMDMGPEIRRKSKLERELVRRTTADFPAAMICALPSLQQKDEVSPVHEWDNFLTALGSTIVTSFQDKCRRYEEELKTVAAQRLIASSTVDDRQYFLLKESVAFTYEQCRLYSDVLFQYEELRALLPGIEKQKHDKSSNSVSLALQTALHGDALAFRHHVRMAPNIEAVSYELEHYLLVRETTQLFALQKAGAVLQRCQAFVRSMWQWKERQAGNDTEKLIQANKWALEFGWVVKEATHLYTSKRKLDDRPFATALCDLMSFTRLRLLKLGKLLALPVKVNLGGQEFPQDLRIQEEWQPWSEPGNNAPEDPEEASLRNNSDVVAHALGTKEGFEWMYMSLTKLLASNQETCGRKRLASCLRLEAIDIAIRQNRLRSAAQELRKVAKECEEWKNCHFFLMFRLCQLQRQFEPASKYLETLVESFAAPQAAPKARQVLFEDLKAVTSSTELELQAPPIFHPVLSLEQFEMSASKGTERNLFKKVYSIGDTVSVRISVISQLLEEVEVDSITIALVPFQTYVAAMEDSTELTAKDTFHSLHLKSLVVKPGENEFRYEWVPIHSGQFILSSVVVQWQKLSLTYNPKERKRPTIRVDVIPCEHSQKLQITPNYLVPGQTQNVLLEYQTGEDSVFQGKLQVVGSPGILVGKADAESLLSSEAIDIQSTPPGSTVSIPLKVQCSADEGTRLLKFQANTHFSRNGGEEFEAQLDVTVPALGQRPFEVKSSSIKSYKSDRLLICAELQCHAPESFLLKGSELKLPDYLQLECDLNETLIDTNISTAEQLLLAFDCRITGTVPETVKTSIIVVFDNGQGTTFEDSYVLLHNRPTIPLPRADMPAVPVEVAVSAEKGIVGLPVELTCTVDTSKVKQQLYYTVNNRDSKWIFSGRTQGPLAKTSKIQFMAIPTIPGKFSSFLDLSLRDDKNELPLSVKQPSFFLASDPNRHYAVAYPLMEPDCNVM